MACMYVLCGAVCRQTHIFPPSMLGEELYSALQARYTLPGRKVIKAPYDEVIKFVKEKANLTVVEGKASVQKEGHRFAAIQAQAAERKKLGDYNGEVVCYSIQVGRSGMALRYIPAKVPPKITAEGEWHAKFAFVLVDLAKGTSSYHSMSANQLMGLFSGGTPGSNKTQGGKDVYKLLKRLACDKAEDENW